MSDSLRQQVTTHSQEETEIFGERVATALTRGSVVLLFGDLGAGKTTLVRGIAKGLNIDPGDVSSPTFVSIQEYRGRLTLYHVDLYRVQGTAVDDLGLEELAEGEGVIVIEWAERLPRPLPGALRVMISDQGGNSRRIVVEKD